MMLMGVPIVREVISPKHILEEFMEALGTSINASKSQIYFFNTRIGALHGYLAKFLGL